MKIRTLILACLNCKQRLLHTRINDWDRCLQFYWWVRCIGHCQQSKSQAVFVWVSVISVAQTVPACPEKLCQTTLPPRQNIKENKRKWTHTTSVLLLMLQVLRRHNVFSITARLSLTKDFFSHHISEADNSTLNLPQVCPWPSGAFCALCALKTSLYWHKTLIWNCFASETVAEVLVAASANPYMCYVIYVLPYLVGALSREE